MKKIISWISATLVLLLILSLVLNFTGSITTVEFNSVFSSVLINLVNFLAAILLFKISVTRSNKTFLIFTLGGMGVRLLLVILFVTLLIKFLNIDKLAFILQLFILYFCLLAVEIKYYSNFVKKKTEVVQ